MSVQGLASTSSALPEDDEPVAATDRRGLEPSVLTVITLAIGVAGITWAYRVAGRGDLSGAFPWFWLGLGTAFIGAVVVALQRDPRWAPRAWAIGGLALLCYLPMLLRRPTGPLFYDELAHWGQTQQLLADGRLGSDNIVSVISQYPGLHVLAIGIIDITHLPAWTVAHLLVASVHVLMLFGIAQLARALRFDTRIAALAAIVYAANPGFIYFTSMFAYESLAIVFELWAVVAVISAMNAEGSVRRAWIGTSLVLLTAVALTHHLSALTAVALLAILWVATLLPGGVDRRNRRLVGLLLIYAAFTTFGWMLINGGSTLTYLGVFPQRGFDELKNLLDNGPHQGSSRSAFGGSSLPAYELKAAYLAIPVVGLLAVIGAWVLRRRWRDAGIRWLVIVSALYPISLPFVLTTTGAPGAHRSWPFTWQALSLLVAVGIVAIVGDASVGRFRYVTGRVVAVIALITIVMGSQATDFNAETRFPGEYQSGIDARQVGPETAALTSWLRQVDNGRRSTFIASDFLTAGQVAGRAGLQYDSTFPTWDLTFYPVQVKPESIVRLATDGITYLVIDRRVTQSPFRAGVYLDNSEPLANVRTKPIPVSALDKLERVPWLVKVYASANYDVYRVVPSVARATPIPPGGSDAQTQRGSATPTPTPTGGRP